MTPPTTTSSLVEPATGLPLETVTPIKPSEAIRLGCLIAPLQAFHFLFTDENTACVLGAMALGYGYDGPREPCVEFTSGVGDLLDEKAGPDVWGELWKVNDDQRLTREQIAADLESRGL